VKEQKDERGEGRGEEEEGKGRNGARTPPQQYTEMTPLV